MKTKMKPLSLLLTALFTGATIHSQNHLNEKSPAMETLQQTTVNKELIRDFYEKMLNNRDFTKLNQLVAEDCNGLDGKGKTAFENQIRELLKAVPDAHWTVDEIIAEGNTIVVKQQITGTQTGTFQNLPPTGKAFINSGIGIFEFRNGQIIRYHIQTDRLGFLQQLGLLPIDISTLAKPNEESVYFIDRFFVPKTSITVFTERMNHNRDFIKKLDGFIKDEVLEYKNEDGSLNIMTLVLWKNNQALEKAKMKVQEEYKRIHFNPLVFCEQNQIKIERGIYKASRAK